MQEENSHEAAESWAAALSLIICGFSRIMNTGEFRRKESAQPDEDCVPFCNCPDKDLDNLTLEPAPFAVNNSPSPGGLSLPSTALSVLSRAASSQNAENHCGLHDDHSFNSLRLRVFA